MVIVYFYHKKILEYDHLDSSVLSSRKSSRGNV